MDNESIIPPRKSKMNIDEIYFWTATINNWHPLLANDEYKDIIINSWDYLSARNKIDVFAFVIMPTHLHAIWRMNELNGKETPQGSFLKYTSHLFKKSLLQNSIHKIPDFRVDACNKNYEFWQRDPLAIPLYTRGVAMQKLDYIHENPVRKNWNLAKFPADYKYSSAKYYETGKNEFGFIKNLWEVI